MHRVSARPFDRTLPGFQPAFAIPSTMGPAPCPCGSGKKHKKCCLPKNRGKAAPALVDGEAVSEKRVSARRLDVHHLKEAVAERLAHIWHAHGDDAIAVAAHVVELVQARKLADARSRDLMRYPNEPDGWNCLGIVDEARGETWHAADCYRKKRDIM